jgi:ATP/maltotriose-dependent transcriptional regulator MalT
MDEIHQGLQALQGPLPWALLDLVDYPMVLVADGQRAVHANRAARLPMSASSAEHCVQARLADGTGGLAAACLSAQRGRRTLLQLNVDGDRRARQVAVLPVDQGGEHPAALVMFERPALCQPLSLYGFGRGVGLTDAEARVLSDLWGGSSPQQIASSRQVALSTVRTHIVQIRSKTGAQTMAGVMRQIAMLPPMLEVLAPCPAA